MQNVARGFIADILLADTYIIKAFRRFVNVDLSK
nr:MAG TPA: hypothetical protein [Bacteriophage sp.]